MIIKPWGMSIWDLMKGDLDRRIKKSGAENVYFPVFIPLSFFAQEAAHVEGFAKECAVVTHYRLKQNDDGSSLIPDPSSVLDEPLVVRPTSETIIWHSFSKWIHSYRDLPLKINQWCNVVRWELRTRPFLRSSEFLWQEGHTAHSTAADAQTTARDSLNLYADFCEVCIYSTVHVLGIDDASSFLLTEILGDPVHSGQKVEHRDVCRCRRDMDHRGHDAGRPRIQFVSQKSSVSLFQFAHRFRMAGRCSRARRITSGKSSHALSTCNFRHRTRNWSLCGRPRGA